LPALEPILDTTQDQTVSSEALSVSGFGGNEHARQVNETPLESSNTDDASPSETDVRAIDHTLDDATAALTGPVSVVDLSTSDTVSVAVATVHNTATTVDRTVSDTLKTVDKTLQQATNTLQQVTGGEMDQPQANGGDVDERQSAAPHPQAPTLPDVANDTAREAVGTLQSSRLPSIGGVRPGPSVPDT
jgi:hypothetical protein